MYWKLEYLFIKYYLLIIYLLYKIVYLIFHLIYAVFYTRVVNVIPYFVFPLTINV